MSKFITRTVKTQRVDPETGELLQYTDRTEIIKNDLEPFFLTYSRQVIALLGMSIFNATVKVLWKLLEFAEYNTGKVYMNAERVGDIEEVCKISRATYTRAIKDLKDAGIITKKGTTITINEDMFWKGDRAARDVIRQARLKVSFSPEYEEQQEAAAQVPVNKKKSGIKARPSDR